jgi:hypothetical protein
MRVRRFVKSYLPIIASYGRLANHPTLSNVKDEIVYDVAKRMYFSSERSFFYFRVPKAGSSSIVTSLGQSISPDMATPSQAQRRLHAIPMPDQISEAFSFTFVRDPLNRVVSAYLDKSREPKFVRKYPYLGGAPATQDGFHYFLDALADGHLMDNLHWAPQADMLPIPPNDFEFIGKLETLEQDLRYCLTQIFGTDRAMRSHRPHKTKAKALAEEYVGHRQRKQIASLYAKDFEAFYPDRI